MTNTPVALIVFNRPRFTRQVFDAIRLAQPSKLFLIADGPRELHPSDIDLCAEVKSIIELIDWPCEVHRNYANINLGLKARVSSGLNWVFSIVDKAIVLEDDCLPHPDFFNFCETLLERYSLDERVWVITGDNHQMGQQRGDASYFFARYSDCWGWATWKRAWLNYQGNIPFWPEWKNSASWNELGLDSVESKFWTDIFNRVYSNDISSSWFYPWLASIWFKHGLTAISNVNLVSNIGIGPDATHTISLVEQAGAPLQSLGPISHPDLITPNVLADKCTFNYRHGGINLRFPRNLYPLPRRIASKIYQYLRKLIHF